MAVSLRRQDALGATATASKRRLISAVLTLFQRERGDLRPTSLFRGSYHNLLVAELFLEFFCFLFFFLREKREGRREKEEVLTRYLGQMLSK